MLLFTYVSIPVLASPDSLFRFLPFAHLISMFPRLPIFPPIDSIYIYTCSVALTFASVVPSIACVLLGCFSVVLILHFGLDSVSCMNWGFFPPETGVQFPPLAASLWHSIYLPVSLFHSFSQTFIYTVHLSQFLYSSNIFLSFFFTFSSFCYILSISLCHCHSITYTFSFFYLITANSVTVSIYLYHIFYQLWFLTLCIYLSI